MCSLLSASVTVMDVPSAVLEIDCYDAYLVPSGQYMSIEDPFKTTLMPSEIRRDVHSVYTS